MRVTNSNNFIALKKAVNEDLPCYSLNGRHIKVADNRLGKFEYHFLRRVLPIKKSNLEKAILKTFHESDRLLVEISNQARKQAVTPKEKETAKEMTFLIQQFLKGSKEHGLSFPSTPNSPHISTTELKNLRSIHPIFEVILDITARIDPLISSRFDPLQGVVQDKITLIEQFCWLSPEEKTALNFLKTKFDQLSLSNSLIQYSTNSLPYNDSDVQSITFLSSLSSLSSKEKDQQKRLSRLKEEETKIVGELSKLADDLQSINELAIEIPNTKKVIKEDIVKIAINQMFPIKNFNSEPEIIDAKIEMVQDYVKSQKEENPTSTKKFLKEDRILIKQALESKIYMANLNNKELHLSTDSLKN